MKVVSFSNREFKKVSKLPLSNKIINTEAELYLYEDKNKWDKRQNVIKIFYNPDIMNEKYYTIGELLKYKDEIGMPELVMPEAVVSVNKEMVGYIMPYIDSCTNMNLLLNNPNVSLKDKLKFLKEIYLILEKIESIKALEGNFFLGDIHESNFVFDVLEQRIKVVDMDSAYINHSSIPVSKFMTFNDNLWDYPAKYPMDEDDRHIPSHNTQTLCFTYMLLNTLSREKSYNWSKEEYYLYLECLKKMKMEPEIVNYLSTIYDDSPNIHFDVNYLDFIDSDKNYCLQYTK